MTWRNELKAVTFDVFGTVVDWRSSIAQEVDLLAEAKGLSVDGAEFASAWRALYQPAMSRVRTGELPFTPLDVLHRMNLDEVLGQFGIEGLSEPEKQHLNRAWHRLHPWPDVLDGLTRIKSRFIIGTLSNGNVSLIVNMAKHAGLPWDVVLGAEIVGHYKPQPEAYLKSAAVLDLKPTQCMLVAAHNNDLLAAAECGFRTGFVPRPVEYGPDQISDQSAESEFDILAEDFVDLAARLGC
ncbi:MAG: haloacid dehalogenase type II [Pseudomonadota bacterium]|nr:haloacid dehalogenase type II [Pseudomonadota bacterium]